MDELTLVARLRDDYPAGIDLTEPERLLAAEIRNASAWVEDHGRRGKRAAGSGRRFAPRLVVAGAVAAAAAVAATVSAVQAMPARPAPRPRASADVLGLRLASYASKAAASAPAWQPDQWIYSEVLFPPGFPNKPGETNPSVMWTRVDYRELAGYHNGKLTVTNWAPYSGQITSAFGRSVTYGNLYSYLQSLPTTPAALRAVIEHNVANRPGPTTGPFASAAKPALWNAIQVTLTTCVLPPKLLAAVYGILATEPGVRFDKSVTDNAGQTGVGFYVMRHFLGRTSEDVIMINPTTYAYLGGETFSPTTQTWSFKVGGKTVTRTWRKGEVGWLDLVASGIVQEPGQKP
jgi:hypothetical protein